jgi:cyclophilin family peptidyl-prolyl cis-trans isomerase
MNWRLWRLNAGTVLATAWIALASSTAMANQWARLDYNISLDGRARDTVFIELFDDKPITRNNFMAYVNGGKYNGMFMHRLARDIQGQNFVMQGGAFYPGWVAEPTLPSFPWSLRSDSAVQVDLDGNPATANPQITNEYSVGQTRSNVRGTLAMARVGEQINSATSQWFVNYKNNGFLDTVDEGFTVFGEVRGDGMNYFDALATNQTAQQPNGVVNQILNPDANDNGTRESGVFGSSTSDAVPLWKGTKDGLVIVEDARRVNYFGGTGSSKALNVFEAGYTLSNRPTFFDTGATIVGTGTLTVAANASLGLREGFTLTQPVINQGSFEPGLRIGQVNLQSYQQTATGTLAIDIAGATVDTQYDRLAVAGTAQLAGKLKVSLLSGFAPTAGQKFDVLTAGTLSGLFTSLELPALSNGLVWGLSANATTYSLNVLRADYNENGVVDAGDYTMWRDQSGKTVTPYTEADGDGNGVVNGADFTRWRNNFGKSSAALVTGGAGGLAASAVPEPAAVTWLFMGACLAGLRRLR